MKKGIIVFSNIFLLILGIVSSVIYSNHLAGERTELTKNAFESTVETMVQVSMEQFNIQQSHANEWCDYITESDMTMDEAMEFLRKICNDSDVSAQIIDVDTFTGCSTKASAVNSDDYTVDYAKYSDELRNSFLNMMYEGKAEECLYVSNVYASPIDGIQVVAFGGKVNICTDFGEKKDYLMLRLVYLNALREQWVFPTGYENAEIGIITLDGDYVIRSNSMKSENFYEFIRAYNELTYPQKDELQELINSSDSGVLEYKNARGVDSYWVYAGLQGNYGNWLIVGYIPKKSIQTYETDWPLVFIVAGILLVLLLIDGIYFIIINHKLRISMKEAEESSSAKTRFLSTMSHDIRTPMNAIIGMTTIAKAQINNGDHLRECLDKITLASNHLLTLINDILDISRIESGNLVLNPVSVSISKILDDLQDIMRTQINEKKQKFEVRRIDITQDNVYADDLRLRQIFINILSNAVKYTPNGGSITLTMKEEKIPDKDNVRLIYTVKDTGIGMEKDFLNKIFEPFTRVEDSRIDTVEGSGLGMAIVKQMVDTMNGTITVESELHKGSEFCVMLELPIVYKNEENSSEAMQNSSDSENTPSDKNISKLHLLIAEDNDMNWEIIHELLGYYDITSECAVNGKICVEMLEKAPADTYSAILMDIQMPIMNGHEAARAIRALNDPQKRDIPIIAMTANAFAEDVQACLDSGMNGHVAKPVDIKLLLKELNKIK